MNNRVKIQNIHNDISNYFYEYVFIIASYNNEKNIFKNISSIVNQTYKKWRIIYVNDASTDNTDMVFKRLIKQYGIENKVKYIVNDRNMKQSYSKYHAYQMTKDNEIVCILDGDDWLATNDALMILNRYYNNGYKIVTSNYNIIENGRKKGVSTQKYTTNIIKNKHYKYNSNYAFCHLKTGYSILFKNIPEDNLKYKGKWLDCCTDIAEMFSVIDLCDSKEIIQIPEILYNYNKDNSILYDNSYYNIDNEEKIEYRFNIINKLRTQPDINFELPKLFIIHLNTKNTYNMKLNMLRQMKYINNDNYQFYNATHYSEPDVFNTYEEYLTMYFDNDFVKYKSTKNAKEYDSLFNIKHEHCTQKALGLITSTLKLYEYIETKYPELDHVTILEDDVYSLLDYKNSNYISNKYLKNKDFIYLGCQNNDCLYNNNNILPDNIYEQLFDNNNILYYGTYSYICSKKIRRYVLKLGIEYFIEKNLSLDLFFNYIRIIDNPNKLSFYKYYKQLFIPEVRKDGIQNKRNNDFYFDRKINLNDYYI